MKSTKLYTRDGRRFVPAEDATGKYLNADYTLSKERTPDSIAICVLHTVKKMVFCELNDNPPALKWNEARKYCSKKFLGHGRLPEIHELLMARNCFRNIFPKYGFVWSNTEYDSYGARGLTLSDGGVSNDDKDDDGSVFAFLDYPLDYIKTL